MQTRNMLSVLILLIGALLLPGCGADDSKDNVVTAPPETGIYPESEAALMQYFRNAYEDMDVATLAQLLHPDYLMILQQSTIDQYPDVGSTLDFGEETRIGERMMSGVVQTNPEGELVPAISAISFDHFAQQGEWVTSPPNDAIPGTRSGLFEVAVLFTRPGYATIKVVGSIRFFVLQVEAEVGGENVSYWQLSGQMDLTLDEKAGRQAFSWGTVKAMFR